LSGFTHHLSHPPQLDVREGDPEPCEPHESRQKALPGHSQEPLGIRWRGLVHEATRIAPRSGMRDALREGAKQPQFTSTRSGRHPGDILEKEKNNMLGRIRFPRGLVLSLALLLAAAGCSNLPTQPLALTQSESGAVTTDGQPAQVLGLLEGSSTSSNTKSAVIGVLGGTVSAGDFKIVVPPLALTQTATITVTQPDLTRPVVNLSISPASANKFLLPVLLVANASRMDRSLLSVAYISYLNPTTGKWETVPGCTVSLLNLTVTAPLSHFSTYRVESGGKAGW
jgi:hypothetical protein